MAWRQIACFRPSVVGMSGKKSKHMKKKKKKTRTDFHLSWLTECLESARRAGTLCCDRCKLHIIPCVHQYYLFSKLTVIFTYSHVLPDMNYTFSMHMHEAPLYYIYLICNIVVYASICNLLVGFQLLKWQVEMNTFWVCVSICLAVVHFRTFLFFAY